LLGGFFDENLNTSFLDVRLEEWKLSDEFARNRTSSLAPLKLCITKWLYLCEQADGDELLGGIQILNQQMPHRDKYFDVIKIFFVKIVLLRLYGNMICYLRF